MEHQEIGNQIKELIKLREKGNKTVQQQIDQLMEKLEELPLTKHEDPNTKMLVIAG